jgi:hypothetical protein
MKYVFESDEPDVTKEQVAETAADFMTHFSGVQVGAIGAVPRKRTT